MSYARTLVDYSNKFENQLSQISHYKNYPQMMPWVGSQYGVNQKKILIIGESHYLPKGSTIQKIPEYWYNSTIKDLGFSPVEEESEVDYTETAEIVSCGMNNWNDGGHRFYKFIHNSMREAGINLDSGPNDNLFRYVAFYNFFQRPAEVSGGSLKRSDLDDKVAYEVFEENIKILDPDAIFVVSVKVWDALMNQYWETSELLENNRILIQTKGKKIVSGYAPHPACYRFWYKSYPRYKNSFSGKEEFMDFLNKYFICH